MRVKICGITRLEDAQVAVNEGAWALGFIFHPASLRYIAPEKVREMLDILAGCGQLPEKTVGVFVNQGPSAVRQVVKDSGINTVQLHGDESPDVAQHLSDLEVIKAFRIKSPADLDSSEPYFPFVSACLYDAANSGGYGGTGTTADWSLVAQVSRKKPLILAGGLSATNVLQAVRETRPHALDLSSGVEHQPGVKDHGKIRDFFAIIRGLDASLT